MVATVAVAVFAATASSAPASESGATVRTADCGPRVTFLVWPRGHGVIRSVRFPSIPNPHVEMYLGLGNRYPESDAGAYIVGGKPPRLIPNGDVRGPCLNYGSTASPRARVAGGRRVATKVALKCTFPGSVVADIVDRPGRTKILLVHRGKRLLARAVATPTRASLTVSMRYCRRGPVPR